MLKKIALLSFLSIAASDAFTPIGHQPSFNTALRADSDDILKPDYEIEPIPMRIGHGFDIHRMAPLEEAGQPVVIGGVEIPHKDQKVILFSHQQTRIICMKNTNFTHQSNLPYSGLMLRGNM